VRHYNPYYFYRPYYPYPYAFSTGWYYPFGFSFSFGYGCCGSYGYGGYPYGPYPYASYPYFPYYGYYGSALRLQVVQREAEVFIDGYYAGKVDNFDGTFQRLNLSPGQHNLELFMPGHRSYTQKIYVQPGSTFRVQHQMEPLGAGEPEPVRPVSPEPPPGASARNERPGPYERPTNRGPQRNPAPRASDRGANTESEFGSLVLRVQPGEDVAVTIDGTRWEGAQEGDRLVVELGAGTHTVEIRKDGYRAYITDITIHRGETTPLNVALTRQ
jgi:hypothetical protein